MTRWISVLLCLLPWVATLKAGVRVEVSARTYFHPTQSSWDLVLEESGEVRCKVWGKDNGEFRLLQLSPAEAAVLEAAITTIKTVGKAEVSLGEIIVDGPVRTVIVIDGDQKRRITIYSFDDPTRLTDEEFADFQRVFDAWRQIRSLVPDSEALDFVTEDQPAAERMKTRANKTPLPTPVERPPSNHSQVPGAADL